MPLSRELSTFYKRYSIRLGRNGTPIPELLCFREGGLCGQSDGIERFQHDERILIDDVEDYVKMSGSLNDDVKKVVMAAAALSKQLTDDDADDDGDTSYCSVKGCGRNYPHEHVGTQQSNLFGIAPRTGDEIFRE